MLILALSFATFVSYLMNEEATEDFVANVDIWQLFTRICDTINRSPTGPKDAVRAIRRRFVTSVCSNESIAMNSLLLLEVCMSRCGYRFYIALGTRENLRELAKYAAPEVENVPECVRNKLLALLQTWALQFEKQVDLQEFVIVYAGLKGRGVSFPDPVSPTKNKPNEVTPIGDAPVASCPRSPSVPSAVATGQQQPATQTSSTTANSVSRGSKLDSDLAQIRVNICVLSDLVTEAETSETINSEAKQLMADVAVALQEMSRRLIQAISCWEAYQETLPSRGTTDSVLLDMINVNDELHTVLLRYSRTVRTDPDTTRQNQVSDFIRSVIPLRCGWFLCLFT
ncbi:hypothetical protein PHET_10142 [Paragonimus heterotremus]|uniref:VHS domain-containing protein n=1 Tax=Paragonimus heterotremus TaxID=100268 RepID=A0A8J4T961_9TREM|nr:hypothetical protein PHET_10142 [Paragonimus heterotremus]